MCLLGLRFFPGDNGFNKFLIHKNIYCSRKGERRALFLTIRGQVYVWIKFPKKVYHRYNYENIYYERNTDTDL